LIPDPRYTREHLYKTPELIQDRGREKLDGTWVSSF